VKKQQGVALFSALLVFALLVILLGQILIQRETAIEKTSWSINSAQLKEFSLASEQRAMSLLLQHLEPENKASNTQEESIYEFLEREHTFEIDSATVDARFYDAQGLINPNSISGNQAIRNLFTTFLESQGSDESVTFSLIDWIDPDDEERQFGGPEGVDFSSANPPYASADRPMSHVSELLVATDIEKETYSVIAPLMLALPKMTRININTAPASVFEFINSSLNGEQIVNTRNQNVDRFSSVNEFMTSNLSAGATLDTAMFTTETEYFYLSTRVLLGKLESNHSALYHYNKLSHSMELLSRLELHSRASNLW